jgi:hypothetical protein
MQTTQWYNIRDFEIGARRYPGGMWRIEAEGLQTQLRVWCNGIEFADWVSWDLHPETYGTMAKQVIVEANKPH